MPDSSNKEDQREEILSRVFGYHYDNNKAAFDLHKRAMDEYFEQRAMELLEYMVEHGVDCDPYQVAKEEGRCFWYKGEWITAKELFENFL